MSTGQPTRARSRRVASVELPPGFWGRLWYNVRQGRVLAQLLLCAATAILLCVVTRGWAPPLTHHKGDMPTRNMLARVEFEVPDEEKTREEKQKARQRALAVFTNDPEPVLQLQAELENALKLLVSTKKLADLVSENPQTWTEFELEIPNQTAEQQFQALRGELMAEGVVDAVDSAVREVVEEQARTGLIRALPSGLETDFGEITVRHRDGRDRTVEVGRVRTDDVLPQMTEAMKTKIPSAIVAQHVIHWLEPKLQSRGTLTLDNAATKAAQDAQADQSPPFYRPITPDADETNVIARAGEPIDEETLALITQEYETVLAKRSLGEKASRVFAILGMYVALYTLCGFYVFYHQPDILRSMYKLATLLAMVVVTVTAGVALAHWSDPWQAELVPLLLIGMTIAIVYEQPLALLMSAAVTLIYAVALGHSLYDAMIFMGSTTGAILVLGRVRSRSKLLTVGLVAAIVALLTSVGVGTLENIALQTLLVRSATLALWCIIAGSLMTCLLPLVERLFGVQTDISLIELGDPAHPLLQELIRRAPGTYNHSITVASLAEAAAEAIGARSLLVRVGAYFHDIGKMLKPGYFIENQSHGDNRHESLVPAMSTLVIIAHVKDGADLARQHHLPEPIIDFIQQHHGTTLVEFFYRRASEQQNHDPDGGDVDESTFRYPGPKPQTREAAVLMLADAVESASRVLVEPTPARIESLVEDLTMKRLLDGQFDECGLTLREVRRVEESLVKSLTAVYHGRVKYPEQVITA